ncbi:unnamed protein product [Protopolystoma xenopodis]|uniref:Ribonuclease PIN domain-containing protein n=1 Tax=Protopolystoma xenopodis TaxID=117903 RepID=A0A448XA10_9PLAT|nr:unnamed protein product [Protopolystoma xenopodis]
MPNAYSFTMCDPDKPKVAHIVADSSSFLRRFKFDNFGVEICTSPEVIRELKDVKTREFIQSIQVPIRLVSPEQDYINRVVKLSKKTGDFTALSKIDISLIALTYQLHCNLVGDPKELEVCPHQIFSCTKISEMPAFLPLAFSFIPEYKRDDCSPSESDGVSEEDDSCELNATKLSTQLNHIDKGIDHSTTEDDWITADNFEDKSLSNYGLGGTIVDDQVSLDKYDLPLPQVACLTSDFAMQNVLMHAGLSILSIHGMLIKRPQAFMLWCASCYR